MSYFYNALFLAFSLCTPLSWGASRPSIEFKTQNRIAKDEPAVFKAKFLEPGISEIRLRYKFASDEAYRWVDFEFDGENTYKATVLPSSLSSSTLYYYVVWKNDAGQAEAVYGSPDEPLRVSIDRRPVNGVLHQSSSNPGNQPHLNMIKDRFGDDEAKEQVAILGASDERSLDNRVEKLRKSGARMSEERIEQMGGRDLADVLRSFPQFDFSLSSRKRLQPVINGLSAQSRVKLKIDDIELLDEFDGSNEWMLDALSATGIAINDGPGHLLGESSGLLSEINVETPRNAGLTAKTGAGWPLDVATGITAGKGLGRFENYWVAALRRSQNRIIGSSFLKTEYWWDGSRRPFLTGRLHVFGTDLEQYGQRIVWNASLKFEFPFSAFVHSRLSFFAGQTFFDQNEPEKNTYRLLRTGLEFSNDFKLHASHLLVLNVSASFVGLANSPFHFEGKLGAGEKIGFELGACELLGLRTSATSNCRLKGSVNSRYRYQIAYWTAVTAGLEVAAASNEVNDLKSLLHPSLNYEISPNKDVDLSVGYSSSLRWPTLLEKSSYWTSEIDSQVSRIDEISLAPEKLKQIALQMRWRLKSDYAHITLDLQGRTGWLDDQIGLSATSANDRAWMNRGTTRFSAFNLGVTAKLAESNQVYFGSQVHSETAIFPNLKIVLGTRLNLNALGSAHMELQALSHSRASPLSSTRVKAFYHTRLFFNHFIFEAHVAHTFHSKAADDENSSTVLFGGVKVLL